MKLIIREYLASLRERNELDVLLPDLLSQMGLEVFSKPGIGNRQYGVDVAAFGIIDGTPAKVYLFSIKAGDLGRKDWNSGSLQDLQPSLDEILSVYIPHHLPPRYKDAPIEICICFGGDIKEEVRLNISAYETTHSTSQISFSEWGGERLSGYIEKFFLREELLPEKCHRLIRKSLAMIDEPDVSFNHYCKLIKLLSSFENTKANETLIALRQLNICLWILYVWCREAGNLESAFLSSERTLLYAWSMSKDFFDKKDLTSKNIQNIFLNIQLLKMQISSDLLETKILPHVDKLYALSNAITPHSSVDVNLKLFDIAGRIAIDGLWLHWHAIQLVQANEETEEVRKFMEKSQLYRKYLKQLISNNPMLFTPYKDEHAIDISFVSLLFAIDPESKDDLHRWLLYIMQQIEYLFHMNGRYPSNLRSYYELLEHPIDDSQEYKQESTQGSILYPIIALFAALLDYDDVYQLVQKIKSKYLQHSNFQVWYPDETSEKHYYLHDENHGATLSDVCVEREKSLYLEEIFKECEHSKHYENLSAVIYQMDPILLIASRHYRMPVPINFFQGLRK